MNTTIETSELRALTAVVAHGSFTGAAEGLGTDKAHVSRTITRLEKKLGARLLERSTRRLNITEIGREFYERAIGILTALESAENVVAHSQGTPTGTLKLTAGPEFGTLVVNQWIADYLKAYPEVTVEAEFTNRITDVIHEGFDVSIRIGALADSELSARKIGEVHYGFYASPNYLKQHGRPETPADLDNHQLIGFSPQGPPTWKLANGRELLSISPDCRYIVNNNQAALAGALSDLGVALLPEFMTETSIRDGTLESFLTEWRRIPVPIHAVFASSRYMAPKVRAFVDTAFRMFRS